VEEAGNYKRIKLDKEGTKDIENMMSLITNTQYKIR